MISSELLKRHRDILMVDRKTLETIGANLRLPFGDRYAAITMLEEIDELVSRIDELSEKLI